MHHSLHHPSVTMVDNESVSRSHGNGNQYGLLRIPTPSKSVSNGNIHNYHHGSLVRLGSSRPNHCSRRRRNSRQSNSRKNRKNNPYRHRNHCLAFYHNLRSRPTRRTLKSTTCDRLPEVGLFSSGSFTLMGQTSMDYSSYLTFGFWLALVAAIIAFVSSLKHPMAPPAAPTTPEPL